MRGLPDRCRLGRFIVPGCCEPFANPVPAVYLAVTAAGTPMWVMRCPCPRFGDDAWDTVQVIYCPFCGQTPPPLEPNPTPPAKVYTPTNDGYCACCGERLLACRCWPEVFRWRPAAPPEGA